jgi:hypothetical protein
MFSPHVAQRTLRERTACSRGRCSALRSSIGRRSALEGCPRTQMCNGNAMRVAHVRSRWRESDGFDCRGLQFLLGVTAAAVRHHRRDAHPSSGKHCDPLSSALMRAATGHRIRPFITEDPRRLRAESRDLECTPHTHAFPQLALVLFCFLGAPSERHTARRGASDV